MAFGTPPISSVRPVGRRAHHLLGADIGAGAGLVLDDDRGVERGAERLGQQPRDDVDGAAGRERHDDPDRLAGRPVALRVRRARAEQQGRSARTPVNSARLRMRSLPRRSGNETSLRDHESQRARNCQAARSSRRRRRKAAVRAACARVGRSGHQSRVGEKRLDFGARRRAQNAAIARAFERRGRGRKAHRRPLAPCPRPASA